MSKYCKEKYLKEIDNQTEGFSIQSISEDYLIWNVLILGPDNSPYEGRVFTIEIVFSSDYPFKPPKIYFLTKIFHPNIILSDVIKQRMVVDIFNENWSPALSNSLTTIIVTIQSVLSTPDFTNCANQLAKDIFLESKESFDEMARGWSD